jgi:hypothetical protein
MADATSLFFYDVELKIAAAVRQCGFDDNCSNAVTNADVLAEMECNANR